MAAITVRNVSDQTHRGLKARARSHGRSTFALATRDIDDFAGAGIAHIDPWEAS